MIPTEPSPSTEPFEDFDLRQSHEAATSSSAMGRRLPCADRALRQAVARRLRSTVTERNGAGKKGCGGSVSSFDHVGNSSDAIMSELIVDCHC